MDTSYVPESRNGAFEGGRTGTGLNHATSIQQIVPRAYQPAGILQLPNMLQTANGEAQSTFQRAKPFDSSMQALAQSTGGISGVVNQ